MTPEERAEVVTEACRHTDDHDFPDTPGRHVRNAICACEECIATAIRAAEAEALERAAETTRAELTKLAEAHPTAYELTASILVVDRAIRALAKNK
jgi:hypothetical protein